jgi:cyclic pyranopterin phosphate synthase
VSLDTLDPDVFAKMSGGFGGVAEVLEASSTRGARARAHQDQHRRAARRERSHAARPAGAFPRHRRHRALHRIHGRGHAQSLEPALVVPSRELAARISARWPLRSLAPDYRGEVAERHAFEDGMGEVGFISSVSQPFCGDCTRARISSDGSFYTCLFATQGVDLRGPLRAGATDDELFELIRASGAAGAIATASCAPRCATPRASTKSR